MLISMFLTFGREGVKALPYIPVLPLVITTRKLGSSL